LLAVPTSSIAPPSDLTENTIATTNGTMTIKLKPGKEFPKFGGQISIDLPFWYEGGTELVFRQSTICSSQPVDVISIDTQTTSNGQHRIIFSKYKEGSEITLVCNNYRNPIYARTIPGFGMSVSDREEPINLIAKYPNWSFKIDKLAPRGLPADALFDFYLNNDNNPTAAAVPIQTEVGISIEFDMGDVPIDNKGCFVKYTFPNDMPLPTGILNGGYQSIDTPGKQMMLSSTNGINLKNGIEYFINN